MTIKIARCASESYVVRDMDSNVITIYLSDPSKLAKGMEVAYRMAGREGEAHRRNTCQDAAERGIMMT